MQQLKTHGPRVLRTSKMFETLGQGLSCSPKSQFLQVSGLNVIFSL